MSSSLSASAGKASGPPGRRRGSRRAWSGLLFIVPAAAVLVVLRVWPTIQTVVLSFTSWDGIGDPIGVGAKNYASLVSDPVFLKALGNNLLLLLALPFWVVIPFVVAIVLQTRPFAWRFFRLAFFLPCVLSPVIIGIFFSAMLTPDGAINSILRQLGLSGLALNWLGDPTLALATLAAVVIWSSFGIGVLIFMSALGSVDQDLISAARLDGAGWWRIQRTVIFWEILPAVEFWAVLVLISTFTTLFPLVYTLTAGGPGYATYVLDYDIYQTAFTNGAFGYASAIGVVLFAFTLVLSLIQLWFFRRADR